MKLQLLRKSEYEVKTKRVSDLQKRRPDTLFISLHYIDKWERIYQRKVLLLRQLSEDRHLCRVYLVFTKG
ncbi:hypothetical protein BSG1_00815 [Bacillus sp. SG-1]|nr:hypothetical protein BSG1_00815 [Bacillus sp. SG-1]